jgi:hypothetical protein
MTRLRVAVGAVRCVVKQYGAQCVSLSIDVIVRARRSQSGVSSRSPGFLPRLLVLSSHSHLHRTFRLLLLALIWHLRSFPVKFLSPPFSSKPCFPYSELLLPLFSDTL